MPVHDWGKVDRSVAHSFSLSWITHLMEALNGGLLPEGLYAMSEQHVGGRLADVLTLNVPDSRAARGDLRGRLPRHARLLAQRARRGAAAVTACVSRRDPSIS